MRSIVEAWGWYDKGQLEVFLGTDPPQWILDGVATFGRALAACRSDVLERQRKERELSRG